MFEVGKDIWKLAMVWEMEQFLHGSDEADS